MEAFRYRDDHSTSRAGVAARLGDAETLISLIDNKAPLDVHDNRGYLPLHEASQNGHENCVEILLNHDDVKQSVDNQTFEGATCAFLAAANGHSDVLQLLLDNGASVNESNFAAVPPISIAAQNNRVDCLKVLLENEADINKGDGFRWTSLHEAAREGHLESLNVLLEDERIKVNIQNDLGITPVALAAMQGNLECCRCLAEKGADLERSTIYGDTPLILATQNGHTDTVKFLLESGVPSNCSGDKKLTPLHYACYIGDADIAELLLKNKSCIHVNARASQEENYVTPLHLACSEGNLECVKLLLEHDALLDVRAGQRYETPLMALTGSLKESDSDEEKNNYIEICSLLLKSGANALAEIVDTDLGRTKVLEDAIEMNSTELLHLLCEGNYLNLKQNYLLRGKRKSLIICAVECMSVKTFDYIFEKVHSDSKYMNDVLDNIIDLMILNWFRADEGNEGIQHNLLRSFKRILEHFTSLNEVYKRLQNCKVKVSLDALLTILDYDVLNESSWTYLSSYTDFDGYKELSKQIAAPSTLQKYCRVFIRRMLGRDRLDQLSTLGLPLDLTKYLSYAEMR